MKGVKVKINDVRLDNDFDTTQFVLRLVSITKNIFLSETELCVLTYFVLNGFTKSVRDKIIEHKIVTSKVALNNLLYNLRKYGIIIKSEKGDSIHNDYNIPLVNLDAVKIELLIKR